MSYNYQQERSYVFTESGQENFIKIRDKTKELFRIAGCASFNKMTEGVSCGCSFALIACVDRMVEMKEIRLLNPEDWAQHGVYVPA